MGRLLLAYDGSEYSKKALDKASDISMEADEILVLYVVPAALREEFAHMEPAVSRSDAQELVDKAVEKLIARGKRAGGVVKDGDVAEVIIHYAREQDCSIIVVGSKGLSKIGRFSLGSVAEKVAKNADRPVLIVR